MRLAPNFFSSCHGGGVKLEEGATIITAVKPFGAVAYTAFPISPRRIFQLKVITPGYIVGSVSPNAQCNNTLIVTLFRFLVSLFSFRLLLLSSTMAVSLTLLLPT